MRGNEIVGEGRVSETKASQKVSILKQASKQLVDAAAAAFKAVSDEWSETLCCKRKASDLLGLRSVATERAAVVH